MGRYWSITEHWTENLQEATGSTTYAFVCGRLATDNGSVEAIGYSPLISPNAYQLAAQMALTNAESIRNSPTARPDVDITAKIPTNETTPIVAEQPTPKTSSAPTKVEPNWSFTAAQKARMTDIKEAYNITKGMAPLDPFIKIWSEQTQGKVLTHQDLNPDNIDAFMDFIEENPALFDDEVK